MSHIKDKLRQYKDEYSKYSKYDGLYVADVLEMLEQLQDNLEQDEKENGWIPVDEKLPEECVPVNIVWINRNPETYYSKIKDVPFSSTGVYYNGNWYWYSSTCVDYLAEYGNANGTWLIKQLILLIGNHYQSHRIWRTEHGIL